MTYMSAVFYCSLFSGTFVTLNEEKQNSEAKQSPGKRKGVSCLFYLVIPHLINLQISTHFDAKTV